MSWKSRAIVLTIGASTAIASATSALAAPGNPPGLDRQGSAVFVQTQNVNGNEIVAFDRSPDGTLSRAGSYATGGNGGALGGAVVDVTASQGALTADRDHRTLYAVNAGSDTVSVFEVNSDRLALRQVTGSGGSFPVSVTTTGDAVFVLNARDGGSIQGFANHGGHLQAVPAWHRDLGLNPAATPEFTHTAGQVAFTPDGRHLVVTTKAASDSILVYTLSDDGTLSEQPTVRTEPGAVPFAIAFDSRGHVQIADAGTNAVSTYSVADDGTLNRLGVTPTGQRATCWITAFGDLLAASNAGSATVTTLSATNGPASVITSTPAGAGTVDASFTPDGRYLYVQGGRNGQVDAYAVRAGGSLTHVDTDDVPAAAGGEGIVAW